MSFTSRPRVASGNPDQQLIDARVRDFAAAVSSPAGNERLLLLAPLMAGKGEAWVHENVARALAEQRQYSAVLDRAGANDPVAGHVYKQRGLSVDTNFRPNFAIETALLDLKSRGVSGSIRRAAIIGPGLDFTDKDSGFDYYPLQTLQPFALIDSLLRLGLSQAAELRVSVFDISPQTLDHLRRAANKPYTLQLVLDKTRPWRRNALAYWRQFGGQIGTSVPPLAAPAGIHDVDRRAVRIRPEIVNALDPEPLNIVVQQGGAGQYDLIVATNVLVYYDSFEQTLAMLNIESMLTPGGIFLSNTQLPKCSGGTLHPVGEIQVEYSGEAGDGDRVEAWSNARLRRSAAPQ